MTELQRYLAEKVAEDHADGIITRREAMRRLGLLGLGATAAASLLAAETARAGADGAAAAATGGAAQSDDAPSGGVEGWAVVGTQAISFRGPRGTLLGAWAPARTRAARCSSSTRTAA
jgi:carboxymethylenebutenolidase